jgi:hypothetical protein
MHPCGVRGNGSGRSISRRATPTIALLAIRASGAWACGAPVDPFVVGGDPSNGDHSFRDHSGDDLEGIHLHGAELRGTDFTGADLRTFYFPASTEQRRGAA